MRSRCSLPLALAVTALCLSLTTPTAASAMGRGNGNGGGPDRDQIKLDQRNFVTSEGAGVAVVSVERSRETDAEVTIDFATADGRAVAGEDYEPVSGTLAWGPDEGGRKTFRVPIVNDSAKEPAEHFEIVLSNPTGGAAIQRAHGDGRVTIVDNDQGDAPPPGNPNRPGTFKFDERGYRVIEGEQTVAVIAVERARGRGGVVSVEVTTADGTAAAGEDYEAVSEVLTWDDQDSSIKTFEIPILDDDVAEGTETVELHLANPTGGAGILPSGADSVLTILDNDGETSACVEDDDTLCLAGGRFMAEAVWRTADGNTGVGHRIPSTGNAGLFWFFTEDNAEVLVKVLDACGFADRFWVFFAATTNVDFTLTVTDTETGVVREYTNALGMAAEPVQDTLSFDTCP